MKGGEKHKWRGQERKTAPSEGSGRNENGNTGERMETEGKCLVMGGEQSMNKGGFFSFTSTLAMVSTSSPSACLYVDGHSGWMDNQKG